MNYLKELTLEITLKSGYLLIPFLLMGIFVHCSPDKNSTKNAEDKHLQMERLRVSHTNPHLLETMSGKPVFLNNYTAWKLIEKGTREDVATLIDLCKSRKFNMVSAVILGDKGKVKVGNAGATVYGSRGFETDSLGYPVPGKPVVTPGNDPGIPEQYDFWDHVDYVIGQAASNRMYIGLHPTWGYWISGSYRGKVAGDTIIFNITNAYQYGQWLGKRFGELPNIIWMLGGDRSAVYDSMTQRTHLDSIQDFRAIYRAMAEGLADGTSGENNQDGKADYSNITISFHPRKWAPNSSEWFNNDPWLTFNSIQDTPEDQVKSIAYDYNLVPVKPSWVFEGRYEGNISPWGVRYQAYQTVFAGGFGNTYGSLIWNFPSNWRELAQLPGAGQMAHLYTVAREIWTGKQFLERMPDQSLIVGEQGAIIGDGDINTTDKEGNISLIHVKDVGSNRITAIKGSDGKWAMVYSANGRDITIDLSRLARGTLDAFWFNPRNGKWWADDKESDNQVPFEKGLRTDDETLMFDPPGDPGRENDWVLVLK